MAEIIGLSASIIQIVGSGIKLSTSLYTFVDSVARADSDIADIAGDVKLTANTLDSVGKVFEDKHIQSIVSKTAIQDAKDLIKRCETVFGEVAKVLEKRRKPGKDGTRPLSSIGKFSWPLKEQRVELHRRRLESLKSSLTLLLHVLQLASEQARRKIKSSALEEKHNAIRLLHQRQQDAARSLELLEKGVSRLSVKGNRSVEDFDSPLTTSSVESQSRATVSLLAMPNDFQSVSKYSASEPEYLTPKDLVECTRHVYHLLGEILSFQENPDILEMRHLCPKQRVSEAYAQFCGKFELAMTTRRAISPFAATQGHISTLTKSPRRQTAGKSEEQSDTDQEIPVLRKNPRHRRPRKVDEGPSVERIEVKKRSYPELVLEDEFYSHESANTPTSKDCRLQASKSVDGNPVEDVVKEVTTERQGNEIRLRVDGSAPLSLQLNGEMDGRTIQLVPSENGMTDVICTPTDVKSSRRELVKQSRRRRELEQAVIQRHRGGDRYSTKITRNLSTLAEMENIQGQQPVKEQEEDIVSILLGKWTTIGSEC